MYNTFCSNKSTDPITIDLQFLKNGPCIKDQLFGSWSQEIKTWKTSTLPFFKAAVASFGGFSDTPPAAASPETGVKRKLLGWWPQDPLRNWTKPYPRMTGTSDKMINLRLQMVVAMAWLFLILYMLNFFPGGVWGGKMLVKIIIVSYGTPLVLAFTFDFLSPVEPVKIIPRISSRNKKISLSNLENGPKTKHHRKDLKAKRCKIFVCWITQKFRLCKPFETKKTKEKTALKKKKRHSAIHSVFPPFSPGKFSPRLFFGGKRCLLTYSSINSQNRPATALALPKKKKCGRIAGLFFAERYILQMHIYMNVTNK